VGIDWSSQHAKLTEDLEFAAYLIRGDITTDTLGLRDAILLDTDAVFGWMMSFQSKRIKSAATRERLLLYKKECIRVLRDYWVTGLAQHRGGVLARSQGHPSTSDEWKARMADTVMTTKNFDEWYHAAYRESFRQGLAKHYGWQRARQLQQQWDDERQQKETQGIWPKKQGRGQGWI
jgi:hypothetical protein